MGCPPGDGMKVQPGTAAARWRRRKTASGSDKETASLSEVYNAVLGGYFTGRGTAAGLAGRMTKWGRAGSKNRRRTGGHLERMRDRPGEIAGIPSRLPAAGRHRRNRPGGVWPENRPGERPCLKTAPNGRPLVRGGISPARRNLAGKRLAARGRRPTPAKSAGTGGNRRADSGNRRPETPGERPASRSGGAAGARPVWERAAGAGFGVRDAGDGNGPGRGGGTGADCLAGNEAAQHIEFKGTSHACASRKPRVTSQKEGRAGGRGSAEK